LPRELSQPLATQQAGAGVGWPRRPGPRRRRVGPPVRGLQVAAQRATPTGVAAGLPGGEFRVGQRRVLEAHPDAAYRDRVGRQRQHVELVMTPQARQVPTADGKRASAAWAGVDLDVGSPTTKVLLGGQRHTLLDQQLSTFSLASSCLRCFAWPAGAREARRLRPGAAALGLCAVRGLDMSAIWLILAASSGARLVRFGFFICLVGALRGCG
jgi:hypothetical protein